MPVCAPCAVLPDPRSLLATAAERLDALGLRPIAAAYDEQVLWRNGTTRDAGTAWFLIPHGSPDSWTVIRVELTAEYAPVDDGPAQSATTLGTVIDFQDFERHMGPIELDRWIDGHHSDHDHHQWFRHAHPSFGVGIIAKWRRVSPFTVANDCNDIIEGTTAMYGRPAWLRNQ